MTLGPVSFGGLFSGLNTSAVITAELATYQQPLTTLQAQQTTLNTQISDFQTLDTQFLALQQSADALATPTAFDQAFSVSSSNSSAVSASVSSGTSAGSVTLAVNQLATGSTQISAGGVAATNDVVASGNLMVGSGGAALATIRLSLPNGAAAELFVDGKNRVIWCRDRFDIGRSLDQRDPGFGRCQRVSGYADRGEHHDHEFE